MGFKYITVLPILLLVCSRVDSSNNYKFDVDHCRSEVREARSTIVNVYAELIQDELEERKERLLSFFESHGIDILKRGDNITEECGGPRDPTMFPPEDNTIINGVQLKGLISPYGNDPIVNFVSYVHNNLLDEEAICNGPSFSDLNSISEQQFFGGLVIFATKYASPICPLCSSVLRSVVNVLIEELDKFGDEFKALINFLTTILPGVETFCNVLPVCKNEPRNSTDFNSSECFKCTFCMMGSTYLEHELLLVPERIGWIKEQLNRFLIGDFCKELCYAYPPKEDEDKDSLFPKGISQKECVDKANKYYDIGVKVLQTALIPNRICPLTGACEEANPTPNGLHCLKLLCEDGAKHFSLLNLICTLIPDHPELADEYLNIAEQKKEIEERRKELKSAKKINEEL